LQASVSYTTLFVSPLRPWFPSVTILAAQQNSAISGNGKLFEFPAASIKESAQLFWLCDHCMTIHTLKRDDDGKVKLVTEARQEHRRAQAKRYGRAS